MSILSLRIPESLHKRVRILATEDNISINQFITSALDTERYLEDRAAKGNKEKFLKVLGKVPDVAPEEYDRLWFIDGIKLINISKVWELFIWWKIDDYWYKRGIKFS